MFFDLWHRDSFLPPPSEEAQRNAPRWLLLLAVAAALLGAGSCMALKMIKNR